MEELVIKSLEETKALGLKLGKLAFPNMMIVLEGDLGAGKTTFSQAIALGLDVKEIVNSPTFVIMKTYQGRLPLYHIDAYRLSKSSEDEYLEEYFDQGGVVIIEWGKNIEYLLPKEYLLISIKDLGLEKRKFELIAFGKKYQELLDEVLK
ncbi:MAG TPA: tRNA (adenosine(37)-N6)-threonylcarbamoyltransferase complex ATPase subunit type 1 TsaE [Acholeplasma sp.]|nr:tRNA (adenosine(37)-N6)-threonylcarbamoyltransferase complex ATPase subunit type 1 TsaE [Acholeplasma sp.]